VDSPVDVYEEVGAVAWAIAILVAALDCASAKVGEKMGEGIQSPPDRGKSTRSKSVSTTYAVVF
jgi:hypothetical protein